MAALVTVEQQSGSAATMGLLLSYALQVRQLLDNAGGTTIHQVALLHLVLALPESPKCSSFVCGCQHKAL